ncbi:hypothetical protein LINGRAHAP2_LOCUS21746 [Linum grandiflorum]
MKSSLRTLLALVALLLVHLLLSSPLSLSREIKMLPVPECLSRRFLGSVTLFSSHKGKFSGSVRGPRKGLEMNLRKAPPSYSNPTQNNCMTTEYILQRFVSFFLFFIVHSGPNMRIRNSRPQFPLQHPCPEQNALRSSRAHAIRGPLMENLVSWLKPAVADAGRQNSERASMPEMQTLGSQRHHVTGKRERPAENSRVHKRQNSSPECYRPIVLALSANPPVARKRGRPSAAKQDRGKAAETNTAAERDVCEPDRNQVTESVKKGKAAEIKTGPAIPHKVWKTAGNGETQTGTASTSSIAKQRCWRSTPNERKAGNAAEGKPAPVMAPQTGVSEPSPSNSLPSKEDEEVFLEAVDALKQVKPKEKRGRRRPRRVPQMIPNQSNIRSW